MKAENDSNVPDEPQISERTAYMLAIASGIITLSIMIFMAVYVFSEKDTEMMVRKAQAFTPFGAILLAVVTFFTVVWRGLMTARQVDYQGEQIRQLIRQNDAKDGENLAKLLLDGAKLAVDDNEIQALAGLAAINAVIRSRNELYASQAMDLVADLAERASNQINKNKLFNYAADILKIGALNGLISSRSIIIDRNGIDYIDKVIFGVPHVTYKNCVLSGTDLHDAEGGKTLENCTIIDSVIDERITFYGRNKFESCEIRFITYPVIDRNVFQDCNFSNCLIPEFSNIELIAKFKSGGNFYMVGSKPSATKEFIDLLQERDQEADGQILEHP